MNKTNSLQTKSVMTVALLATLLVTSGCSEKNNPANPANDLKKMQAVTEERLPTAQEKIAAEAAVGVAPQMGAVVQRQTHRDRPSTIAGVEEAIDLGKYMGVKGAVFTRVAKAVWKIIEKNQASVSMSSQRLSILPVSQREQEMVSGFKRPITRAFTVTLKNSYGMNVVKYDYVIAFSYGGNVDGRGQYISNLTVIHSNVNVMWGFNLEAKFVTARIENHGTRSNPIAAIPAEVQWKVKNVMTNVSKSNAFWISGKGEFVRLNNSEQEDKTHRQR